MLISDRVTFGVLGPLAASRGQELLSLGGPKQRMVLAVLLANANRTVCRDELIDAVWAGDPPNAARTTMHTYLSNLRKELGNGQIVHGGDGYGVTVDASNFDALKFDELVWQGHALLGVQPHQAALCLDQSLQLWRGPAFGQHGSELSLFAEATRLNELRLFAEEDRFEAYLENGEHARVIGPLRNLIDSNPYRERLLGQLMLALYRSGRQAEALKVFAETRRRFANELGIDPAPELWSLEQHILQQRPSLDIQLTKHEVRFSPSPARTDDIVPVHDGALFRFFRSVAAPKQMALTSAIVGILVIGLLANLGLRPASDAGAGCVQPPAGLIGWWTGNDTVEDEVGGRSAVLVNGASFSDGLVGRAFFLDGVDDWVDVPWAGLDVGVSDFTVDLWVNFDTTTGEQILVEKYVQAENATGWTFTKLEDDSLGLFGPEVGTRSRPLNLGLGEWIHFTALREKNRVEILRNGAIIDAQYIGDNEVSDPSPSSLKFGHRGGISDTPGADLEQGFYLNGRIDEVHLFVGRALTPEEIRSIVDAGSAGICRPIDPV